MSNDPKLSGDELLEALTRAVHENMLPLPEMDLNDLKVRIWRHFCYLLSMATFTLMQMHKGVEPLALIGPYLHALSHGCRRAAAQLFEKMEAPEDES